MGVNPSRLSAFPTTQNPVSATLMEASPTATMARTQRGSTSAARAVLTSGSGLERITTSPEFDSFPMFSPEGRRLVFASNRHARERGETNIFIADWVE